MFLGACLLLLCSAAASGPGETLISGGEPLRGLAGVRSYGFGSVLVCDLDNEEVKKVSTLSGRVLATVVPAVVEAGGELFSGLCDDLSRGKDKKIVLTRIIFGQATEFDIGVFPPVPTALITGGSIPFINPVTHFSDATGEERVLVANGFGFFGISNDLFQVSAEDPPKSFDLKPDSMYVNAFDFAGDGRLLAPHNAGGKVLAITLFENGTTSHEDFMTEIDGPIAVKVNRYGTVVVLSRATGKIWRKNLSGGEKKLVATLEPGLDNFDFSLCHRKIIVTANHNRIWRVRLYRTQKVFPLLESPITSPGGLVLDGEVLFVADKYSLLLVCAVSGEVLQRILMTDPEGPLIGTQGVNCVGSSPSEILVCDDRTGRVSILSKQDPTILLDSFGTGSFSLAQPTNVVSHQGAYFVAEPPLGVVSKVEKIGGVFQRTEVLQGLDRPVGLAVDQGTLYVTTHGTEECSGGLHSVDLATYAATLVRGGLCRPEGVVALPGEEAALLLETGLQRLLKLSSSGELTVLRDELPLSTFVPQVSPFSSRIPLKAMASLSLGEGSGEDLEVFYTQTLHEPAVNVLIL